MTGEMPAEHAILGLLAMNEGAEAGYGYDLARHFSEHQPLGAVLRLEAGMLYHHLKKLERAGWVHASVQEQPSRPARRTYRLADAGREELMRWLGEPVARTRELRLEFLVKLYFARLLAPERAEHLISEQRETLVRLLESLGRQLAALEAADGEPTPSDDSAFAATVLRLRLLQTEAALTWLQSLPAPKNG